MYGSFRSNGSCQREFCGIPHTFETHGKEIMWITRDLFVPKSGPKAGQECPRLGHINVQPRRHLCRNRNPRYVRLCALDGFTMYVLEDMNVDFGGHKCPSWHLFTCFWYSLRSCTGPCVVQKSVIQISLGCRPNQWRGVSRCRTTNPPSYMLRLARFGSGPLAGLPSWRRRPLWRCVCCCGNEVKFERGAI
jgi:hypothetical protein